jgi:hypothetical protein
MVIAVPPALLVERHHEEIGALEGVDNDERGGPGTTPLEYRWFGSRI